MDESEFSWRHLRVRWNSLEPAALHQHVVDGDLTLGGVLTLSGFDRGQGRVQYCDFVKDESLPVGTMVVEPKHG